MRVKEKSIFNEFVINNPNMDSNKYVVKSNDSIFLPFVIENPIISGGFRTCNVNDSKVKPTINKGISLDEVSEFFGEGGFNSRLYEDVLIIKYFKLISEFVGDGSYESVYHKQEINNIFYGKSEIYVLKKVMPDYRKSIDSLLPSIEKIESLGYSVNIFGNVCCIYDSFGEVVISSEEETKTLATHKSVIDFIIYYNESNKK